MIDTPTCACLSAPTSLVPSPHMSVVAPAELSDSTISSFCLGATRANTATWALKLRSVRLGPALRATIVLIESPMRQSACSVPSRAIASGSSSNARPADPTALEEVHRSISAERGCHGQEHPHRQSARAYATGGWLIIQTSRATCAAVSGPSPVIITHRCEDCWSSAMTWQVSALSGQLSTRKPAKIQIAFRP